MKTTCINLDALKPQAYKTQVSKPKVSECRICKPQTSEPRICKSRPLESSAEITRRMTSFFTSAPISPPDSQYGSFKEGERDSESPILSLCGLYVPDSDPQIHDSFIDYRVENMIEDVDSFDGSSYDSADDDRNEAFDLEEDGDLDLGEEYENPELVEQSVQRPEEGFSLNREILDYDSLAAIQAKENRIEELEDRVRELISVDKAYPRPVFFGSNSTVEKYCRAIKRLKYEKKTLEEKYQRIRDEFDSLLATQTEDQDSFFKILEERNKQKDQMVDYYRHEYMRTKQIAENYKNQLMKAKKEKSVLKKNRTIAVRR